MNLDWGLIVVAGIALALAFLIGFVVASVMVGRAGLDHMEVEYEALHRHCHSTLGLKPPKGNT